MGTKNIAQINLGKTKFDPKKFWYKKYLGQKVVCQEKKLCTVTHTAALCLLSIFKEEGQATPTEDTLEIWRLQCHLMPICC